MADLIKRAKAAVRKDATVDASVATRVRKHARAKLNEVLGVDVTPANWRDGGTMPRSEDDPWVLCHVDGLQIVYKERPDQLFFTDLPGLFYELNSLEDIGRRLVETPELFIPAEQSPTEEA